MEVTLGRSGDRGSNFDGQHNYFEFYTNPEARRKMVSGTANGSQRSKRIYNDPPFLLIRFAIYFHTNTMISYK
jgi:hypothetical protein